jgi:hypothetical protein
MTRARAALASLALGSLLLLAGGLRARAQQAQGALDRPGRFAPAPAGAELPALWVLDTWTGRVSTAEVSVDGAADGQAAIVDLPEGVRWVRPLARDVSAGRVLPHGLAPLGVGAGVPVFAWQPAAGRPGIVDTRTGVHYLLSAADPTAGDLKVIRTDLRTLTRSTRDVRGGD